MRHKDKVKLARKMLTKKEIVEKVSKFLSKGWIQRSEAIKKRVNKKKK